MRRLRASLAAASLALMTWSAVAAAGDTDRLLAGFARASAMIETSRACEFLDIWIAVTPEQRAQGLMFVHELGEHQGMLFPGREPAVLRMWMKNTYIPLDMLFLDAGGRIAGITARTTPLSETTITSPGPVSAVLELNGGFTDRHRVHPGHRFSLIE